MMSSRFRSLRAVAAARATPPQDVRIDRRRQDHGGEPGAGSSAIRPLGSAHPTIVDGITRDDDLYRTETFGPLVGVGTFGDWTRRSSWRMAMATACHRRSTQRTPSRRSASRGRVGRDALGEQLDVGCGGPPPVRWQRALGNGSRQSGVWVLDQFTRWQAMNGTTAAACRRPMDVADVTADLDFRLPD